MTHRRDGIEFEGSDDVEDLEPPDRRGVDKRIGKMFTDIYLGRGKFNPSITERLTLLEDHMEAVKTTIKRVERIEWGILLALLGTFLAVIFHH